MPKDTDKLQREIEELLEGLDNFVPEDRFAQKSKERERQRRQQERAVRRAQHGPSPVDRARERLSRITLGHLMITGLALMLFTWLPTGELIEPLRNEAAVLGILLTIAAFALSIIFRGNARTTVGGRRVEKRWRGQVIEYHEPSRMERVRGWWRRRGR